MLHWDDLHTFLLIARHHTLSGAARALGVQQPTMGRRLETLEQRAGARLLVRTPTGFVLTPAGEAVIQRAERIEEEAQAIERAVLGRDERLEGPVRVTTIASFANIILPPILAKLHQSHPGIRVEIISDLRTLSLSAREADIALRFGRFTQAEIAVRRLGEVRFALYAGHDYIARFGSPDFAAGAPGHCVVNGTDDLSMPDMKWMREHTYAAVSSVAANTRSGQQAMVVAGMGIGCLTRYQADPDTRLRRLTGLSPAPSRELWLGVHTDTRHTPRIRVVAEALAAGVREVQLVLAPNDG